MSDEWFYARDGQQSGPFSLVQLKSFVTAGRLKRTDYVWNEGIAEWVPAGQVPELFPPAVLQPRLKRPPPPPQSTSPITPGATPTVTNNMLPEAVPQFSQLRQWYSARTEIEKAGIAGAALWSLGCILALLLGFWPEAGVWSSIIGFFVGLFFFAFVFTAAAAAADEQSKAKKAYYKSLEKLKGDPHNPDLREQTLTLGRKYIATVKGDVFSELTLMNDINAACARAGSKVTVEKQTVPNSTPKI